MTPDILFRCFIVSAASRIPRSAAGVDPSRRLALGTPITIPDAAHPAHLRDRSLPAPITFTGRANLTVKALAPLAVGTQGSYVEPVSESTVRLTFTQ